MQHFIFDLDGTLSNPEIGILNGYRYTFEKLGMPIPSDEKLKTLIGPPLRIIFENFYGLTSSEADFAIETYRHYYNELGGAYENQLYDGIKNLLHSLAKENKQMHIATHKGAMADKILHHFEIDQYFTHIQHYNEEKNIITKEKMIALILEAENVQDKNEVVMIGDRHSDIEAAHFHQIKSVAVAYGFGSVEELKNCQPTFLANDVQDLTNILLQL
ncbi:MAG: HAD hydrolase-like protein [Chitinophagales bacterium]|nr:HAD hydrolase-like protein [Bacteroidota bacterium]